MFLNEAHHVLTNPQYFDKNILDRRELKWRRLTTHGLVHTTARFLENLVGETSHARLRTLSDRAARGGRVYHCIARTYAGRFFAVSIPSPSTTTTIASNGTANDSSGYAPVFAIDICGYAVMSNDLHVILRARPDLAGSSDEEVRTPLDTVMLAPDPRPEIRRSPRRATSTFQFDKYLLRFWTGPADSFVRRVKGRISAAHSRRFWNVWESSAIAGWRQCGISADGS